MLGTLGLTATEHCEPWNFSHSTALNRGKSSIEGLSETEENQVLKAFQNQLVNVQSTCTAVYVVCLQCSMKKWSWQVLIGNCSKSQPLNFDRLVTN